MNDLSRARCNFISAFKTTYCRVGFNLKLFLLFCFNLSQRENMMYHQHGLFPSSAGNMMYPQHGLHYYNPTSGFGWNMQPNYDMLRNSSGTVHSAPSIPPIAETGRRFTIIFTIEEEKNVLTRMIHMHMISDHTRTACDSPTRLPLRGTWKARARALPTAA